MGIFANIADAILCANVSSKTARGGVALASSFFVCDCRSDVVFFLFK